ncbi:MAG: AI-2E family transporter [Planctomycetota bacterium]
MLKRETLISVSFILLLLFIIYQVVSILTPFLASMFWGGILAFTFYPLYRLLSSKVSWGRTSRAALCTTLTLLIIVPIGIGITFSFAKQGLDLFAEAREYIQSEEFEATVNELKSNEEFRDFWTSLPQTVQLNAEQAALEKLAEVQGFLFQLSLDLARNLFSFIVDLVFMGVALFFFFRDGDRIHSALYELAPLEKNKKRILFDRISETFAAVIRGQFLTSMVQGAMAAIAYSIVGLPAPLLLGILTAMTSLIPFTGAATVWVPSTIYLLVTGQIGQAIALAIAGGGGISLIDNFLKPILIGERIQVPVFLLFLGILGGLRFYGLIGLFLAPLMLSLLFALLKMYREDYDEEEEATSAEPSPSPPEAPPPTSAKDETRKPDADTPVGVAADEKKDSGESQ